MEVWKKHRFVPAKKLVRMTPVPAEAVKNIKNAADRNRMNEIQQKKDVIDLLEFEELKLRLTNSKEQINELRDSL